MIDKTKQYIIKFKSMLDNIECIKTQNYNIDLAHGIVDACSVIQTNVAFGGKVLFIGNGGSAAICSHMAIDFWKNGLIRSVSFNDGALLTCVANDFGYDYVFEKPIEMFADKSDVLIAISSSGQSRNILNGAKMARNKGCNIITLSGFKKDNPLKNIGDINFYVPVSHYGYVEVIHQYICHAILDIIIESKNGQV